MASAFGISYSPDCKQSLHWTYATKNYMFSETTNDNSPHPGMFWKQKIAKKTSENFFLVALLPLIASCGAVLTTMRKQMDPMILSKPEGILCI